MHNATTNRISLAVFVGIAALALLLPTTLPAQPVTQHGSLAVSGNRIVNQFGQPVSFAGNSFFWSNDGWGGERFYTAGAVDWLQSDWQSTIVRAAMGVEDPGGYIDNPTGNKNKVKTIVDAAIARGMYVIIDWHSHNAQNYQSEAISFFQEMANTYGGNPNVIYEIYNEPDDESWATIKAYAQNVIAAIRAIDPDNLIIVGTPTWSQDVDIASTDPITGYSNIAYTLHFYAATHKQYLRDKAQVALNNGIALMVTEWGTVFANGDGAVDEPSTQAWMDFLETNQISHLNWAVNDKQEGASALLPGSSTTGGWTDYTASGWLARDIVRTWPGTAPPPPAGQQPYGGTATALPGTLEAEHFDEGGEGVAYHDTDATNNGGAFRTSEGVDLEAASGGGYNVGWTAVGEWLEYTVDVQTSGSYNLSFRVASSSAGGGFHLEVDGQNVTGAKSVPATGGWQTWTTVAANGISLSAGAHVLRFAVDQAGFNFDRITFSQSQTPYGGTATALPGTLEAEHFDEGGQGVAYSDTDAINEGGAFRTGEGVDLEAASGGGYNVGWTAVGEWLEYTVNVQSSDTYDLSFRVASSSAGGGFHLEVDGQNVTGAKTVPVTGGWQTWTDVTATGISLSAGQHVLRFVVDQAGFNFDRLAVSSGPQTSPITVRARGSCGPEDMRLRINDSVVATWNNIGTSLTNRTYNDYAGGNVKVEFFGDGTSGGCDLNLFVDYITVGSTTYQTETSATRTGCGTNEWLWCNGHFDFGNPGTAGKSAAADRASTAPDAFALEGNYPNPFNPSTLIGYTLPEATHVRLEVFDLTGRRVATLVDASQAEGHHEVRFDADRLPSGVYLYRIEAGAFAEVKKMQLIR